MHPWQRADAERRAFPLEVLVRLVGDHPEIARHRQRGDAGDVVGREHAAQAMLAMDYIALQKAMGLGLPATGS